MAHESFEDVAVAAEMNRLFVNIKVDREERPDIDQIYQTAHQLLVRRGGGWPLTMFLTPEGTPFFGGTYFPKLPRHGMPGFRDLLPKVARVYHEQRSEITQQNAALMQALRSTLPAAPATDAPMDATPVERASQELAQAFDSRHGGIGRAPKFPHPAEFAFCLRRHALTGTGPGLEMTRVTLQNMADGGIYDHVGGGFARYSVDETWTIPHFEKMLYDNGPLLALFADSWVVTGAPAFRRVVEETAAWVMREMQAPAGGYYSSLDADSEHEEGKFYVWTPDQVRALLTDAEFSVVAPHYGLDGAPNFEDRHWHLRITKPLTAVADTLGRPVSDCAALVASARGKLLAARARRVWPGRDEKVLTSWNALMIRGMVRAARALERRDWLDSAQRAIDFMRDTLWRDGRLLATCKDGKAHLNAYLDDHAYVLDALLELMQAEFRAQDLDFARALADRLLAQFEDRTGGGFYFTSHDHELLIHRAKPVYDNATPSGNGIAAVALQRLGHVLGEIRYLDAAERALRHLYAELEQQPSACASLAVALEEYLAPPTVVVLRGAAPEMQAWSRRLSERFRPGVMIFAIPSGLTGLPPTLDRATSADGVNAWVCRGVSCLPPVTTLADLEHCLVNCD